MFYVGTLCMHAWPTWMHVFVHSYQDTYAAFIFIMKKCVHRTVLVWMCYCELLPCCSQTSLLPWARLIDLRLHEDYGLVHTALYSIWALMTGQSAIPASLRPPRRTGRSRQGTQSACGFCNFSLRSCAHLKQHNAGLRAQARPEEKGERDLDGGAEREENTDSVSARS